MFVGPSLFTICLLALFMALPLGVVAAACALAVKRDQRRYVLLAIGVVAVVASAATLLLPPGATRIAGGALLGLGMIGVIAAAALTLLRKDRTPAATIVGLIAAPLATAGHLMASAAALAALGTLPGSPGRPEQTDAPLVVLLGGLIVAAVTIVVGAALLLLLQRAWGPLGTGITLGGIAAAFATGGELMVALTSQSPPLTTTTTLMVTALGLAIGTFLGGMRADRSGALAGMPPGNH